MKPLRQPIDVITHGLAPAKPFFCFLRRNIQFSKNVWSCGLSDLRFGAPLHLYGRVVTHISARHRHDAQELRGHPKFADCRIHRAFRKIADEEIEIARSVYLIAKITEMSTKIMSKTAGASGAPLSMDETAESLCEIGREFYRRGWVFGTSGNFSAKISHSPLRLAITSSGLDKGALTPEGLLEIDGDAAVLRGSGYPSAETSLHLVIVGQLGAGAVLHTHSIWSTLLSDRWAAEGGLVLEGYEMLKGLSGVSTHEHSEWVPILENSQEYTKLSATLASVLKQHPRSHGVLLRKHGLYTWGRDIAEARRHVEIFEFLFEAEGRRQFASPS
jgi:methylthioribulose-1-phosphate dehydratase